MFGPGIGIGIGIGVDTSAGYQPPTLNLNFVNEVYEVYEYSELDLSLNLDFVYQVYQSE